MNARLIESFFFLALLLGVLVLAVMMVLPYLNTIILAAVLAFLSSGIYKRLTRIITNRSLAALVMTLLVLITILVPLSLAGYRIAQEATTLYDYLRNHATDDDIGQLLQRVQETTRSYLPTARIDAQAVNERLQQLLGWMVGHLGVVFTGATRIVLHFFFLLLFFYYLIRDGSKLQRTIMRLSPLSDAHEQEIIDRIAASVGATVRGQIVLSFLQGIVAGLGLAFFGVPNPALWGSIVILASFIPMFGTSLVLIPAILYLVATGQYPSAIGLTLWAMTAVGLLDNFLGPKLVSRGTHLHPLITLVAVLGGIGTFGPIGILLGPILMSVLFALFNIYLSLVHPLSAKV